MVVNREACQVGQLHSKRVRSTSPIRLLFSVILPQPVFFHRPKIVLALPNLPNIQNPSKRHLPYDLLFVPLTTKERGATRTTPVRLSRNRILVLVFSIPCGPFSSIHRTAAYQSTRQNTPSGESKHTKTRKGWRKQRKSGGGARKISPGRTIGRTVEHAERLGAQHSSRDRPQASRSRHHLRVHEKTLVGVGILSAGGQAATETAK